MPFLPVFYWYVRPQVAYLQGQRQDSTSLWVELKVTLQRHGNKAGLNWGPLLQSPMPINKVNTPLPHCPRVWCTLLYKNLPANQDIHAHL